jgi:hypothetical protein
MNDCIDEMTLADLASGERTTMLNPRSTGDLK